MARTEKTKIFELDIDVDAAIAANSKLKKSIEKGKEALDTLKKSGDTTSKTYIELEANVKTLNSEYNSAQR